MAHARRDQREGSRTGSILVAVGCLGVLGLTFGVGFYAGRYWTRASPAAGEPDPTSTATSALRQPRRGGGATAAPALTFYEELTAPLATSPPLAAKASPPPAKAPAPVEPRRPAEKVERVVPRAEERPGARDEARVSDERATRPDPRAQAAPPRRAEPEGAGSRFTVQIAAYSARASAEALRNSVSASGHEAYIVESDAPPGAPRYRVRVGSYPTREAAVAAASRLPVPGPRYVTTR